MEQLTGSHSPVCERTHGDHRKLSSVEAGFIENWGALARSFGMDPVLGRVHALAFLSTDALNASQVAATLGLAAEDAARCLESLARWGAVREVPDDQDEPM